ncbi:MAG: glycoside hydrolase family 3 N-terminal domain-containing protein [Candidatus Coproplasma sp.]
MEKYKDKRFSAKERAEDLLSVMSLDEKMAQVQCYFYRPDELYRLERDYPFGVGEVSCLEMRTAETIDEAIALQINMQRLVLKNSPHKIPAIFHMEGLCGLLLKDAVSFPCGLGRAASFDTRLEEEIGKIVGRQASAMGISHILAPVLDVSFNPRFGRYGETYGEDASLVSAMGVAYVNGLNSEEDKQLKTEGVAKHFLGSHENVAGIHTTTSYISQRKLREVYAKPFQAAISEGGLMGIMPCYNSQDGVPVSSSSYFLTDLLRDEMGFGGVTLSDYGAIEKLYLEYKTCATREEAGYKAMQAGMDFELHYVACYGEELKNKFANGEADIAVLDRAVLRILQTKFRMGLFENPFALQGADFDKLYYGGNSGNASEKSADESLVLLKNDGILPIKSSPKRIAVIGYHANTIRSMFGGYTHLSMAEGLKADLATMAGIADNGKVERKNYPNYPDTNITDEAPFFDEFEKLAKTFYPGTPTLYESIKNAFPESEVLYSYGYDFCGTETKYFRKALALARSCDLVILTLGGKHGTGKASSMGENVDATSINLPPCQEEFIKKVAAVNTKIVGVHFDGRPISSDNADRYLNAIIEAWSPSEYGAKAVCKALKGGLNPSGKLPVTVARNAGQTPIVYNREHGSDYSRENPFGVEGYADCLYTPRYVFGYGLSYTKFVYSDLSISLNETCDESICIKCKIKNVGDCFGEEIVQLYFEDVLSSVVRPNKELAGFARVKLMPDESKWVKFTLNSSQLAFLDENYKWKVEAGEYKIFVGASSEDNRLTGTVELKQSRFIEGKSRAFYAQTEVVSEEE